MDLKFLQSLCLHRFILVQMEIDLRLFMVPKIDNFEILKRLNLKFLRNVDILIFHTYYKVL